MERRVSRRGFIKAGVGLAGATTLSRYLGGLAWGQRPFRIGFATALTGVFGKDGSLVRDAYILWKETINAKGGIEVKGRRYPVELVFYDDKSDPTTHAKLVEKLITEDKVDLLLGGYASPLVFAGSAVSEKYKYPMISGGASSNKLFERGFRYYFATLGKATEEVRGAAEVFTIAEPRPETVAIVAADILFTAQAAEGFKFYSERAGFKVIHYELFPMALEDYNSLLLKVKRKNPDVLLVGSHVTVSLKVTRAMKEIDFNPKAVAFSYGPTVPDYIKEMKRDAEYVIAASEWIPSLPYRDDLFGTARSFADMYKRRFGREPDYVEAAAAAGALAQQVAIERAEVAPPVTPEGRERITDQLYRQKLMTFYGMVAFGRDGANAEHPPIAVQVQDGKLKGVYPKEMAEAKLRYPMPPWKRRV